MDRRTVIVNYIWRLLERCGAQVVTAVVSVVLARLLDPTVYGTVALVTVLTTILQVFVDSGLGNALIQKKNADDLDFSSVFYFNIAISLVLYLAVFLSAPVIAGFYGQPELVVLLRVLALTMVIAGVKNVQQAYVSRNMMFKKFFLSTLGGTIGAAVLGIWMAVRGYGVWALVAQGLLNNTVDTLILWLTVPWRPKRMFSLRRLKGLFSFGWKLLCTSLLSTVYANLRQLVIGKIYSPADLAFYNKGNQFPAIITSNLTASMDSVLLPAFSSRQDDLGTVRGMTRRAARTIAYVLWPLMMGLAAIGEPLVRLLLTEKWIACVPFLYMFCLDYAIWPADASKLNAINAIGRSDVFMRLQLINRFLGVIALLVTAPISPFAMACSLPLLSVTGSVINAGEIEKLLGYTRWQQLLDMLPPISVSLVMFLCVWSVRFLGLSDWLTIVIQVPLGAAIYIGLSRLLRLESFFYLRQVLKQMLGRKQP